LGFVENEFEVHLVFCLVQGGSRLMSK